MKRLLFILLFLPFILGAQDTLYVSTTGNDANAGTFTEPFATWKHGCLQLDAGDVLYIRAGVYYSDTIIYIYPAGGYGNSGTQADVVTVEGYPADIALGNFPILDCSAHCDSMTVPGYMNLYNAAFKFYRTQHWHLKCLHIRNVFQCDSVVDGGITATECANMTYERLILNNIGERGIYQTSGAWSYADSAYAVEEYGASTSAATPYFSQPDTTRFINCDIYNIFDTLSYDPGNAADGIKTISYYGNYYYWEGNRVWHYADDGIDPNGGERVFMDNWVMSTNKYYDQDAGWEAERNGIKTSVMDDSKTYLSYYTPDDSAALVNDSLIRTYRSLALFCGGRGFYTGLESDTCTNSRWYNLTAYKCGVGFSGSSHGLDSIGDFYKNCLSYAATTETAIETPYDVSLINVGYGLLNSSWIKTGSYPYFDDSPSFTVSDADFVTVDSATLVSLFTAPRQADGSLPVNRPLMLAEGSDLIDGGVDVGLPYNGTAPDLGYSEYSDVTIPIAAFSVDNTTVCKEDSVQFTDATTNTPLTWAWSFPGGSPDTSNLQNPKIEYPTAGTYTVSLYVTNADSSDTETKTNYITVRDSVVANFSASETSVNTGANISFTDLTTNNPSSWSWTFAGGTPSVSTSQNPTIQYNTAGTYTVTLEATNTCNSDTETKTGHITVSNPYAPASSYRLTIKFR